MLLSRAALAVSMLVACSTLGACAAGAVDSEDPSAEAAEESVEEAALAFGEATCATEAYANYEDHTVWPPFHTGVMVAATTGSYGQEDCTHAVVVDYNNGTTYDSRVNVTPWSVPTNQSMCEATHVRGKSYEEIDGAWVPFEETALHGEWLWGSCVFLPDAGYGLLHLSENPTRVTGQAYWTACLMGSCFPVHVGVKIQAKTLTKP